MDNLTVGDDPVEFYVWVDPSDFLVKHHVRLLGCFISTPAEPGKPTLMFRPDPGFQTAISPFQNNLLRRYIAEYNLEINREALFPLYPSRMHAVFLLESEDEAQAYGRRHPDHVAGRVLKRAVTNGPYRFSVHDSGWVDFLRLPHSLDDESIGFAVDAYWTGRSVQDIELQSMGMPWTRDRVSEVLFEGRIDFPDRSLPS